jgi:hypothetical protein
MRDVQVNIAAFEGRLSATESTFLPHLPECNVAVMRRPDRYELELTMLMFIVLAPLGYWLLWTLMAIVG